MVAGQICNRMNMDTGNLQVCMDDLKNLFGERATIYSKYTGQNVTAVKLF